jgi:hypothetical protein
MAAVYTATDAGAFRVPPRRDPSRERHHGRIDIDYEFQLS